MAFYCEDCEGFHGANECGVIDMRATLERLRASLESLQAHSLKVWCDTCEERDAARTERDEARAEVQTLNYQAANPARGGEDG
jgi:hypothetical protein